MVSFRGNAPTRRGERALVPPSTETDTALETLDRERAIAFAAVAAVRWAERAVGGSETRRSGVLRDLMMAASWASRARAHHGATSLAVGEIVRVLEAPMCDWLPGAPSVALLEKGEPTPLCYDMAEDAGPSPAAEAEQRVLVKVMNNLGAAPGGETTYTRFRRFLVEQATAAHQRVVPVALDVGVALAELYEEIPASVCTEVDAAEVFYPCPRCRWPMQIGASTVRCAHSEACLAAGARFDRRDGRLVPIGALAPPEALPRAGQARLLFGIWRYTTLPGLEELDLHRRLVGVPGVKAELWPMIDRYDLDVSAGDRHWRVDVKDHASPVRLASRLLDRSVAEETWIVVPEARRDQVPVLRRLCPADTQYCFASSNEFLRRVRRAVEDT